LFNVFKFQKIKKYIGECLIGTLTDGLKEDFTPKTKKAWTKMFGVVESHMKVGMRQAESEKSANNKSAAKESTEGKNVDNANNYNGSVSNSQNDETNPNGHYENHNNT
jgi:hypothetical protein